MSETEPVRCTHTPGCGGVAVLENMCLAHVPAQALPQLVRADRVDGRGARYDAARLDALVSALPLERGQHQAVGDLLFDHAVFEGRLDWSRLDCRGRVSFRGAHFKSEIGLGPDCSFQQVVDFDGARFLADTEFAGCSFVGGASFRDVVFEGTARFSSFFDGLLAEECVFKRYTTLQHLIGQSHITWSTTRFEAPVFIGANVSGRLRFPGSTFVDAVQFSTTKATHVDFVGARFQRGGDLGTLACDGLASFQDATFENPIRLRVRASSLDLRRSLVLRGGEILVEGAFVALAGASFQRPTTLAATRLGAQDRVASENHPAPRLGQLAGADVGELTIDGFDLTACRFAGAHNLDHLRFGDAIDLPQSPQRRVGRRRRTVYDEHQVRVAAAGEKWALAPPPPEPFCLEVQAASSEMPAPPVPVTVAGVYRALRKAREDSKDASGASDFYYGEMEMRRRSEPGLLLRVYWLVSGYGTRASRALVGYLGVVVALGLLMHQFGFEKPQPSLIRAFSFTLTSTVFVGHTPGGGLTPGGDIVQLALRILGPLLIGLALLALRTRVQR